VRIGYSFWGFLGPGITDTPDRRETSAGRDPTTGPRPPPGQGRRAARSGITQPLPAPAGDPHDLLVGPCPCLSGRPFAPGAEGMGTERERPATGYRNHALASELPHQRKPEAAPPTAPTRRKGERPPPPASGRFAKPLPAPTGSIARSVKRKSESSTKSLVDRLGR
jgi:hypothetical protein